VLGRTRQKSTTMDSTYEYCKSLKLRLWMWMCRGTMRCDTITRTMRTYRSCKRKFHRNAHRNVLYWYRGSTVGKPKSADICLAATRFCTCYLRTLAFCIIAVILLSCSSMRFSRSSEFRFDSNARARRSISSTRTSAPSQSP